MARGIFTHSLKLVVLLALPLLILGGFSQARAENLKVALVLPGVITDKSFNQGAYEGLMYVKNEMGIEVAYSEKVAQPDQAEALADYARRGYNLVFGGGGEFQDAVDRVAKRYPDTMFAVINGKAAADNVAIFLFDYLDTCYVVGYFAGKMSHTGIGAFIGAQQIPAWLRALDGFEKGFMAARPDGKVLAAWTNDWDEVAKGKEAALSVISQGADIVFPTMDNAIVGTYQGAKEKNKYAIGIFYDFHKDWPDTIIQSAVMRWDTGLVEMVKLFQAGKLEGKIYTFGFETPSVVSLGTYSPVVPEALRQQISKLIDDIKSGKFKLAAK